MNRLTRNSLSTAIVFSLASCGGPEVGSAARSQAVRFVRTEQAPLTVEPVAMWYAEGAQSGTICGEIAAPAALQPRRKTLRYVYFADAPRPFGQVEYHELNIASNATTQILLDANRSAFDALWDSHCAPFAPVTRRVAAFFG